MNYYDIEQIHIIGPKYLVFIIKDWPKFHLQYTDQHLEHLAII